MKKKYTLLVLLLIVVAEVSGQTHKVYGVVRDSLSNKTLPNVVIYQGTKAIYQTDSSGRFAISIQDSTKVLYFSLIGYAQVEIPVQNSSSFLEIFMIEKSTILNEVVINKRGKRYRNKGNPAVEFIEKVIAHKPLNSILAYPYLHYYEHGKVSAGFLNTPERIVKNPVLRSFPHLKDNLDTQKVANMVFLPLFLKEQLVEAKWVNAKKEIEVLEQKQVTLDESLFDNNGINTYISYIYQDFDIYDNTLMAVTNQFISPIANNAPLFYRYDLLDTVTIDKDPYIKLLFTPRNAQDFLFMGDVLVALDSSYAVKEINMTMGKHVNINWVRSINIAQTFSKNKIGKYVLSKSTNTIEFSILKNKGESILTERTLDFSDYKTVPPSEIKLQPVGLDEIRSAYDKKIYSAFDSLTNTKRFKTISNIINIAGYGYFSIGKKFEGGTVGNFIGGNTVEGFRLRFGGRTTPVFSKRVFLDAYTAYGFKDQKWKYFGSLTYSFSGENKYIFPMKNITFSYRDDMEIPGNGLRYLQDYGFLANFARTDINKWIYYKRLGIRYVQEFKNRFSFELAFERNMENPAGELRYISEVTENPILSLTTSEIEGVLRWAPHEKYYQGKTGRASMATKYPVFMIRGKAGFKDFLGGDYSYQKLYFNVQKRFYLSAFGFTDAVFETGATFGKNLPFPLLDIMRGNQTFTFQEHSYNMMNFMEFVADRFASVKFEHNFNGVVLNKIPLISKLKLRELVTLKVLYGNIRQANTPQNGNGVFLFPEDKEGGMSMYSLNHKPYIEGGLGVGNIFKVLRVDVVKRFSYLDHPDAPSIGFRMRLGLNF